MVALRRDQDGYRLADDLFTEVAVDTLCPPGPACVDAIEVLTYYFVIAQLHTTSAPPILLLPLPPRRFHLVALQLSILPGSDVARDADELGVAGLRNEPPRPMRPHHLAGGWVDHAVFDVTGRIASKNRLTGVSYVRQVFGMYMDEAL